MVCADRNQKYLPILERGVFRGSSYGFTSVLGPFAEFSLQYISSAMSVNRVITKTIFVSRHLKTSSSLKAGNFMKLLQELFWRWCHYCSIDSKPEIAFIELQSFKRFQAKINSTMQWWAIQTNQVREQLWRQTLWLTSFH